MDGTRDERERRQERAFWLHLAVGAAWVLREYYPPLAAEMALTGLVAWIAGLAAIAGSEEKKQ